MRYDLVVSFGPNCRTAWNLRDYFKVSRAYPFDWWITPPRSMLAMTQRDFLFSLSMDDLEIVASEGTVATVFNRRLGVDHHHDFERDEAFRLLSITAEQVASVEQKYQALFTRMWSDLDAAAAPLIVVGGLRTARDEARGEPFPPSAQDVIDGIRDRVGAKAYVAIIETGLDREITLSGGVIVSRPDTGHRETDLPPGTLFAEPVHNFRAALDWLGRAERV